MIKKYLGYGALVGTGLFILAFLMGGLSVDTRQLIGWLGFIISLVIAILYLRSWHIRRTDPVPSDGARQREDLRVAMFSILALCMFFWAATVSQKNYESVVVALAVIGISAVLLYGAHSIFIPKKKTDKK